MVIRIERVSPRCMHGEEACLSKQGYQLGDPDVGAEWHHLKNAVHVRTLEQAAALIESKRFALRMSCTRGCRPPSLIRPSGVRVVRD